MEYRLIRQQVDLPGRPAGDWIIERKTTPRSKWAMLERWPSYDGESARSRLRELELAELPQIFN